MSISASSGRCSRARASASSPEAAIPQTLYPLRPSTPARSAATTAWSSTMRSVAGFIAGALSHWLRLAGRPGWQGKEERGAGAWLALRPDPAIVAFDDALDDGQTHPRAGEIGCAMEAVKWLEELCCVREIQPCTVVADMEGVKILARRRTDFDRRVLSLRRILERVAE